LSCLFYISIPQANGDTRLINAIKTSEWEISDNPYSFGPQNLYEYIDGAADFFVAYGFVLLEGTNYVSLSDVNDSITVDIYDMGEKLNAFGVFQSKRSKGAPSLDIGTSAFGADGYLCFYKDKYLVEIFSFIKDEKRKSQDLNMARKVAEIIQGDTLPPVELSYFPEPEKIDGSERYIKGGILGHAFLDRGIICDYRIKDETVSAFLAFYPSREEAVKAFEQHRDFLAKSAPCTPFDGFGERGLVSQEPYHKSIILVQKGTFITGVYDLSTPKNGTEVLKGILKRINLPDGGID